MKMQNDEYSEIIKDITKMIKKYEKEKSDKFQRFMQHFLKSVLRKNSIKIKMQHKVRSIAIQEGRLAYFPCEDPILVRVIILGVKTIKE